MKDSLRSPRISSFSWGHLEVEGQGTFKDAKLFPGGAQEWDWRKTGTTHTSGIQPADVEELIEQGARVIILTKGVRNSLNISQKTLQLLEDKGIPAHILQTEKAVKTYNELIEKEQVGGLFHSTC